MGVSGAGDTELRPDQRLTPAQAASRESSFGRRGGPNDKRIRDLPPLYLLPLAPVQRLVLRPMREQTFMLGLGDAAYYCSPDGELAVREAVYGQTLSGLRSLDDDEVNMHVVSHSLGAIVAYDFLFGLFAPSPIWDAQGPDFVFQGSPEIVADFWRWRSKTKDGTLRLGSLTTMDSQVPVLLLRKQRVVDASVIGIRPDAAAIKWKIFCDVDDILSFPTRNLFGDNPAIMDIQVGTADRPDRAHDRYWVDGGVAREVAGLLTANLA